MEPRSAAERSALRMRALLYTAAAAAGGVPRGARWRRWWWWRRRGRWAGGWRGSAGRGGDGWCRASQGPPPSPRTPPGPPPRAPPEPGYPGVVESTAEYAFVERLLPPTRVPDPPKHPSYPTPSGWSPPRDPPPALPYFVRRSRMHNVPVYRDLTHGNRKMTVIRKIEGDIWALEGSSRPSWGGARGREPLTQVNELTGTLRIKGYFDGEVKAWLLEKGF
ncbi:large ribosomal subunit protein mL49 [Apteryx mantelli]|uniref:Large ribosomal subunit protein mL49 n=1 Tax=Apteryx mantelli TaxID=2696672 RepID=A0ABM4G0Z3_9AVES